MRIKFLNSIRWKLALSFLGIIFLTVIAVFFGIRAAFLELSDDYFKKEIAQKANSIAKNISEDQLLPASRIPTFPGISVHLLDQEGNDVPGPGIKEKAPIRLTSRQIAMLKAGETVSGSYKTDRPINSFQFGASPVVKDGKFSGILMVVTAPQPLQVRRKFSQAILRTLLFAALISSLAAFLIAGGLTRPILEMEKAARGISRGDFSRKIESSSKDEVGALAESFDLMSDKLSRNIQGRMQMMADISHEIRTPLASIEGCTEAIIDGVVQSEEEKQKYLETILSQSHRLSILLSDLTELSRFEAGEVKMSPAPFSPDEVISSVIQASEVLAEKKGITLELEKTDEKNCAMGDADRISQALLNLTANAIQHTPQGTRVVLSCRRLQKEIIFSVKDDGPGIPDDDLPFIFDRFHKVDKSRTRGDSGSGLGLAIVKEIIKAHGSTVSVRSGKDGATFRFSLPYCK